MKTTLLTLVLLGLFSACKVDQNIQKEVVASPLESVGRNLQNYLVWNMLGENETNNTSTLVDGVTWDKAFGWWNDGTNYLFTPNSGRIENTTTDVNLNRVFSTEHTVSVAINRVFIDVQRLTVLPLVKQVGADGTILEYGVEIVNGNINAYATSTGLFHNVKITKLIDTVANLGSMTSEAMLANWFAVVSFTFADDKISQVCVNDQCSSTGIDTINESGVSARSETGTITLSNEGVSLMVYGYQIYDTTITSEEMSEIKTELLSLINNN